jgi:hypothetical protein
LKDKSPPLIIEGTLRHQNNIETSRKKYGDTFICKIINTDYFDDDDVIPTLVVSDDISLILGKPRYPEKFTNDEYKIKLVDRTNCGLYSIEVLKHDNDNNTREKIKEKIIKEIRNQIDIKVKKWEETKFDDEKKKYMELIKFLHYLITVVGHKLPSLREQVEICYIDYKIIELHKKLKILNN